MVNANSKEKVLELVARQLMYYELDDIAEKVAEHLTPHPNLAKLSASNQLADCVRQTLSVPDDLSVGGPHLTLDDFPPPDQIHLRKPSECPLYSAGFNTTHKYACTASAFSVDGRYVATGSADTSLKVLDVEKMKACATTTIPVAQMSAEEKPLIRTLYDHLDVVTDVAFHPNGRALASCSDDCTIKFYDLQRVGIKRAFRHLQDSHPVKSLSFHPSGDYLLAATTDEVVRLYDVTTLKCFKPALANELHAGGIQQAVYSPLASMYATCGVDGHIRLWDGVNNKCIRTLESAHQSHSINSISFSRNGSLLLSTGADQVARLFDVAEGKMVQEYKGAQQLGRASLNWSEDLVLAPDALSTSILIWCSRTGKQIGKLQSHGTAVQTLTQSPVENTFLTGGNDNRARLWTASTHTD